MDEIICGMIIIAALFYLVYKVYRFFINDEVTGCFGEQYRWTGEREETGAARKKEGPDYPVRPAGYNVK